jgi:tetratricopeptide (TPR) repeat protein
MIKESQKRVILSLGMVFFLILSSCGWGKKEQRHKVEGGNPEVEKQQVEKQRVKKQTNYVQEYAQKEIEAGNLQNAINLYKEIYQKWPQGPNVRSGYIKTLESIKSGGDHAFERKDYKPAERNYEVLLRNWDHFSDLSQFLSFRKTFLEKKIKTTRCLLTEEQVSSHLKAGDFRRAVDLCREVYQKYPQDPTVRNGYIKALESIKMNGDRAFEGRDFALAGSFYETVLRNISSVSHLNGSLSFSKEGLTARISNCKKVLFEDGLKQYRSGNLNQAISLWKSILAFDPDNREIKKAVNMATLQLENLQDTK